MRLGRLDPQAYDRLRRQVLERDGWRCQQCGQRRSLEVHHLQLRSQSGADEPENLITLCRRCHQRRHLCPEATG
jgi:5-methylcytosine-specific restriction endonuclease McrA